MLLKKDQYMKLFTALENEVVAEPTAEYQQRIQSLEEQLSNYEVTQAYSEVQADQNISDNAKADVGTLTKVNDILVEATESDKVLTKDVLQMSRVVTESICARLGYKATDKLFVATEDVDSSTKYHNAIAIEGFGEMLKRIWVAIFTFIGRMADAIKSLWNKLFNINERTSKKNKELIKQLKELNSLTNGERVVEKEIDRSWLGVKKINYADLDRFTDKRPVTECINKVLLLIDKIEDTEYIIRGILNKAVAIKDDPAYYLRLQNQAIQETCLLKEVTEGLSSINLRYYYINKQITELPRDEIYDAKLSTPLISSSLVSRKYEPPWSLDEVQNVMLSNEKLLFSLRRFFDKEKNVSNKIGQLEIYYEECYYNERHTNHRFSDADGRRYDCIWLCNRLLHSFYIEIPRILQKFSTEITGVCNQIMGLATESQTYK